MILVDLSQIAISNVMMSPDIKNHIIDAPTIKLMIFNSLRAYKQRFGNEYGQFVICCDSKNNWRKQVFEHYKHRRKITKKTSLLDWAQIDEVISSFSEDLRQYFPYKVIKIDGAEADDIIAVLSMNIQERIVIVSSDHDYGQLHIKQNVSQCCPKTKNMIYISNPANHLKEMVIRGDQGDDIPNIRSQDNSFAIKKRNLTITTKDVEEWLPKPPEEFCDETMLKNYKRNERLIDFKNIPENIKSDILEAYQVPTKGNKNTIFNYFVKNGFQHMIKDVGQF